MQKYIISFILVAILFTSAFPLTSTFAEDEQQMIKKSALVNSIEDPGVKKTGNQMAVILPPTGKWYSGTLYYNAPLKAHLYSLDGPVPAGSSVKNLYMLDEQTWFEVTKIPGNGAGKWNFAGNALLLYRESPEPFSASYTIHYVESDDPSVSFEYQNEITQKEETPASTPAAYNDRYRWNEIPVGQFGNPTVTIKHIIPQPNDAGEYSVLFEICADLQRLLAVEIEASSDVESRSIELSGKLDAGECVNTSTSVLARDSNSIQLTLVNEKELEQRLLRIEVRLAEIDRQITALHKEQNELTKVKAHVNLHAQRLGEIADETRELRREAFDLRHTYYSELSDNYDMSAEHRRYTERAEPDAKRFYREDFDPRVNPPVGRPILKN